MIYYKINFISSLCAIEKNGDINMNDNNDLLKDIKDSLKNIYKNFKKVYDESGANEKIKGP